MKSLNTQGSTINKKLYKVTYNDLIIHLDASFSVLLCFRDFQKNFRQFFKFTFLNNDIMNIKCKFSNVSIKITNQGDNYYHISSTRNNNEYLFYIISQKELLDKLIKHSLI